jgi:hypothetical protein
MIDLDDDLSAFTMDSIHQLFEREDFLIRIDQGHIEKGFALSHHAGMFEGDIARPASDPS